MAKLPPDASRGELVRGEFKPMSPASFHHGTIAHKISLLLGMHILQEKSGVMCAAETGFLIAKNPDTVRAPDAAFVTNEKFEKFASEKGFFDGAPDLAVEVISPSETAVEIETKIIEYLEAGTQLVWILYPQTQTITIHQAPNIVKKLANQDMLIGDPLFPNFSVPVDEIFG
ncbi:MAG: Uma2 family endonuclease [Chloroflexota bacterium]